MAGLLIQMLQNLIKRNRHTFKEKLNNLTGIINISIPYLQTGLYIVQVKLKDKYVNQKILIQQK
jgi:hypothetical protein